jgi:hypothetical protein
MLFLFLLLLILLFGGLVHKITMRIKSKSRKGEGIAVPRTFLAPQGRALPSLIGSNNCLQSPRRPHILVPLLNHNL